MSFRFLDDLPDVNTVFSGSPASYKASLLFGDLCCISFFAPTSDDPQEEFACMHNKTDGTVIATFSQIFFLW